MALAPRFGAGVLRALLATCRVEVRGQEHWEAAHETAGCAVVAFWHESLPLAMWRYRNRGYHTLASESFDGELAARTVARFGFRAVRGSSSRHGRRAVIEMTRILRDEAQSLGLTVDAPRGPRRQAKPGAALIAARAQVPLLPNAYACTHAWRLSSWDRMMIPKPFSRIICVYGAPLAPAAASRSGPVEESRMRLEGRLNKLHAQLEAELGQPAFTPAEPANR